MASASRIIEELNRLKKLAPAWEGHGKIPPWDFFDLCPIADTELENFCSMPGSQLLLKIAKRLAERSPEEALKAIMAGGKRQICGHCSKAWIFCNCPGK